ncbi:MAG: ROK family transcriptional regulator [Blautia sp.]|nr:ROK family transcriptional regulator [Blautia sp.]
MKKTITPGQISQTNLALIYQYIYRHEPVSQQDISYDLRLSRPTVASKINELETLGLIRKDGQIASDLVGSKAAAYTTVPDYRVAVGVEIMKDQIKMLLVDLRGNYYHRSVFQVPFANTEEYLAEVCSKVNQWIDLLDIEKEQILGIGFSFQGLVSADGDEITYGKILDCTGLKLESITKHMSFPCRLLHDADAAARSELWASPELPNFLYFNISMHLGAAVIFNRQILSGKHGYAGTMEHIQIEPHGKQCYCGKRGCAETLGSLNSLLEGEDEDTFFALVLSGDKEAKKRWTQYLHNLARIILHTQLMCDTDVVLGGYLATRLQDEDLETIYAEMERISPFQEYRDFLRISKMPKHNITIGAALPYIQEFLNGAFDGKVFASLGE